MVSEVVGDPGLSTEHQEIGRFTSAGVWGAAVGPHGLREHCIPFILTAAKELAPERIPNMRFLHSTTLLPCGWYGVVLL